MADEQTPPMTGLHGEDDTHLRHQVVETGFSAQDEALHAAALNAIQKQVASGKPWDKIVASLKMQDTEMQRIVLDDYLKITLAERHFNNKEGIKKIAQELKIPMDLLMQTKQSMIEEVRDASLKVYQMQKEAEANKGRH